MITSITISVRHLVEFLMRSGDIDNRTGGADTDVMQEGSRMHRQLQQAQPEGYQAEVPLSIAWTFEKRIGNRGNVLPASVLDDAVILIEGRADGIYYGNNPIHDARTHEKVWTVDEIKTTYRRISRMRAPEPVHLAQARCYAYIYAAQHHLERIDVRMTYCNLYSGQIRYFYQEENFQTLHDWFTSLMEEYRKWAEYMLSWQSRRTASIRELTFPFPFREGQKRLVAGVYQTIEEGRKLFLEAPTGTGKTLSTLYPSIKAMGQGMADRIFYLTAKTMTREAAADTVALLRGKGLLCKSVVLTAKDKVCVLKKPECNPDKCPRAKGHYDRINTALFELLTGQDNYDQKTLLSCAEKYQVCPFELALDISLFSDIIIGDYNHLFDPHAFLHRFFGEGTGSGSKKAVFLIDEAHNLLDRGRDMYSALLTQDDIDRVRTAAGKLYPSFMKELDAVDLALSQIRHSFDRTDQKHALILHEIDQLALASAKLQTEQENILAKERIDRQNGNARKDPLSRQKDAVHDLFLDFYFNICHFNLIYSIQDEKYVIYADYMQEGNLDSFGVKMLCVDPSSNLSSCMKRGRAAILFSATLLPIQYYKNLLGGTREDYEIYARSVFDQNKRKLLIVRDVTSRYRYRSMQGYERIAECIHNITGQRHGNYLIFCPSYTFMDAVADAYERIYSDPDHLPGTDHTVPPSDITLIRQRQDMDESRRTQYLDFFRNPNNHRSILGFCVLGGIFGEGIDLRNDSLIGVIVIGTGIPQISHERELFYGYFKGLGKDGYACAYIYPGMNKVLQAAGRLIRTQEDTGIVALLDDRFVTPTYRHLFPMEWNNYQITTVEECGYLVEKFWDEWLP